MSRASRSWSRARRRGLWRRLTRRLTGRPTELLRLAEVFPDGDFPPIDVYELGGGYFVEDGHHRVALARHLGAEYIDANVTRVAAPLALPEDMDAGDLIHLEAEREFLERSGLGAARPSARIRFSRPQGYAQLLDLIQAFGYARLREQRRLLEPEAVAAMWWDERYLPALAALKRAGVPDAFPYRTQGDLFLVLHERRQNLAPGHAAVSLEEAAAAVRKAGHPAGPLERRQRARTKRRRSRPLGGPPAG